MPAMWPFSRPLVLPNDLERLTGELKAHSEAISKLAHDLRFAERELEDLHVRYRRLRGAQGGEARVEKAKANAVDTQELPGVETRAERKARLRAGLLKGHGPVQAQEDR